MNRMTVANGQLDGSSIVAGNTGIALTYDAAGRRRTATQKVVLVGYVDVFVPTEDPNGAPHQFPGELGGEAGYWETRQSNYMGMRREDYEYRADGYLMNVYFADEGYYDAGGYSQGNGVIAPAALRASNARDALGRVTQYQEFNPNDVSGAASYNRYNIVYDAASRVTYEVLSQKRLEGSWHTYTTTTTNTYAGYGGALSYSEASTHNSWWNGSSTTSSWTSYTYHLFDDARVSTTTHNAGTGQGNFTSTYTYDGLGRLASVNIADGRPRTVTFTHNPSGQVLSRIESSAAPKNPADYYYFVDGVQVGELSNNGNHDLTRATYSETFVTRTWDFNKNLTSQPFRWNTTGGVTRGQFGGSGYDPISPTSQGMEGTDGRYTVREGDTLQGIAQQLFGDSSLWYMIAEANGLSGAQSLAAGTSLIVPDKVTNIHNSARTFEVYDPNRALGDLSPTAAKPPKKAKGCGLFGAILVMVVAAVATRFLGPIGGNLVTQGFANLIGQQKGFSWKSLAISVITHEVMGGIEASGVFSSIGSATVQAAATAVAANAVTQGIGVAVGLQKKFDFAGVAAAGAGAAAGAQFRMRGPGGDVLRTAADGIASAAARSLVTGTSFGDNIMSVLPDVIGRSLGNAMADAISGAKSAGQLSRERAEAHEVGHGADLSGAALAAPGTTEAGAFNYITDPIDLGPIDLGPDLGALLLTTEQLDAAYEAAGIDPILRRMAIAAEIKQEKGWLAAEQPVLPEGGRVVDPRDTWHLPTLISWWQGFEDLVKRTGRQPGDDAYLEAFRARYNQIVELDARIEAQVRREIGGFMAAGIVGGATGAGGFAIFGGTSVAGGLVTAGVSSSTSGVPLRWGLGQEISVRTFAQDGVTGVALYGLGRGIVYGINRLGTRPAAEGTVVERNLGSLTAGEVLRIQHFADKYGVTVNVVGSRARGTAGPLSDFDYILGNDGATSRLRGKARIELPRGRAGGEIHPTRGETGIDVFKKPLDTTRPYIPFDPKVPK